MPARRWRDLYNVPLQVFLAGLRSLDTVQKRPLDTALMKRKVRILILCKTYPSPSAKHAETSCVAGMDEDGNLIRLYPVPFRLITEDQQFSKWQWIEALIERNPADHRPESHKISVDSIQVGQRLPPGNWNQRRSWLDKLTVYESFDALEEARVDHNVTLGLIKPQKITALHIRKSASESWTPEEIEKLEAMQRQPSLFDEQEAASIKTVANTARIMVQDVADIFTVIEKRGFDSPAIV